MTYEKAVGSTTAFFLSPMGLFDAQLPCKLPLELILQHVLVYFGVKINRLL